MTKDNYFSAASDDQAVAVYDRWDGPVFQSGLEVNDIDPSVMLGTLEALLTGRRYEDLRKRPRHASLLHMGGDQGPWLVTITDEFVAALANAGDDEILTVAWPWSETEEFGGYADVAELTGILLELRDLAAWTVERGGRLYCRMSL